MAHRSDDADPVRGDVVRATAIEASHRESAPDEGSQLEPGGPSGGEVSEQLELT